MARVRWLTKAEERSWRAYRRMRTLLDLQVTRDLARDSGLSDADYDVLSTLTEVPDHRWRASELAARLLWSSSRLSHHVGRMERRGLVAREGCDADGRGATLTLTAKGWRTIQEAAPAHVESVRRHFVGLLSPDQIAALEEISQTVIEHLTSEERAASDPGERPSPEALPG